MAQTFLASFDIARTERLAQQGRTATEHLRDFSNEFLLLKRQRHEVNHSVEQDREILTRYGKALTGVLLSVTLTREFLRQFGEIDTSDLQEEHLRVIEASEGKEVRDIIEQLKDLKERFGADWDE